MKLFENTNYTQLTEELVKGMYIHFSPSSLKRSLGSNPTTTLPASETMPELIFKKEFDLDCKFLGYSVHALQSELTRFILMGQAVPSPEDPDQPQEPEVSGDPIATLEELLAAVSEGGEFKLEAPMELESTLLMDKEDVKTTINLNNQKVVAPIYEPEGGDSDSTTFQVDAGHLVLQGEGEVVAQEATYSNAVYARGGQVDILGGTYLNAGDNCDLIYAAGDAQINIYDGIFKATKNNGAAGTGNEYTALNIKDKDRETAKITVYGGKFYGFNPANNVSEGEGTNFVAEGYEVVESEEDGMMVYTVQKIEE